MSGCAETPVLLHRGFTLIELVVVILLIGILSVTVLPRFIGDQGFAEYAVRDQLIAGARIAQQRAMYDHTGSACYRLSVSGGIIAAQSFDGSAYNNIGPTEDWLNGIVIDGATVTPANFNIYFNGLGSPLADVANCAGSVAQRAITVTGATTLGVNIYATGYIQEQP